MILGCLFAFLAAGAPRIALLLMWLARPVRVDAAFGGFILPCLGFIFLPFTTLMYVLMFPINGAFDWIFLIIAVVLDIGGLAGSGYANKNQIPGMSKAGTTAA
jgi:hypothetical protein